MALVVCDGPGRHDHRLRVRAGPVARGVADGAGLGDAREADGLLGEADRQLAPLLPRDAEGGVAAGAGHQVAEDPRQHVEDRVGDAEVPLGAERAVLEPLLGRGRRRARRGAPARRRRRPPAAARGRTWPRRRRPPTMPRIASTATIRATVYQGPGRASSGMVIARLLERLQVLDQRALLVRAAGRCRRRCPPLPLPRHGPASQAPFIGGAPAGQSAEPRRHGSRSRRAARAAPDRCGAGSLTKPIARGS